MKRIIYISSMLLLACVAFISCERDGEINPDKADGGRSITFDIHSNWPDVTKSVVKDLNDIKESGFRVWGRWTTDSYDDSNDAKENEIVFGSEGAVVHFDQDEYKWVYDDEKEWHSGYYNFAAVLPPTQFVTSHSSTFTKGTSAEQDLKYSNLLTLNLGSEGFNLGEKQVDFMYAFHNEDNSADEAATVSLKFEHSFSLVDITLVSNGELPVVKKVTLYGIHSTIHGSLKYRQDMKITGGVAENTDSNNLSELLSLADVTTEQTPYAVFDYSEDSFMTDSSGSITLVDDLLVFPESLSAHCALRIQIECSFKGVDRTIYTEVTSGSWEPGKTYTYQINVDSIPTE